MLSQISAGQAWSSPGHHNCSPPILPHSSACSDPCPLAIQGQSPCAARLQVAQAPWPRLYHTHCVTQCSLKALTCGLAAQAGPLSYGMKWSSSVRTLRARNGGTANNMCTSLSQTSRYLKLGCVQRERQALSGHNLTLLFDNELRSTHRAQGLGWRAIGDPSARQGELSWTMCLGSPEHELQVLNM